MTVGLYRAGVFIYLFIGKLFKEQLTELSFRSMFWSTVEGNLLIIVQHMIVWWNESCYFYLMLLKLQNIQYIVVYIQKYINIVSF